MNQSKLVSFYEALANTMIGYILSLAAQLVIYPAYGATFTLVQNLQIGVWFLLISLLRGYVIRRWFNDRLHRAAKRMAGL